MTRNGYLCNYKNALGKPGQGIHKYRLFGIAIVDLALTVLGSWAIARAAKKPFWMVLAIVFLIGIALHRLFCVETTVDTLLRKFVF